MPRADDIDINALVALTDDFSGAEVVAVCSEAAYLAIDDGASVISQANLQHAAEGIQPQITPTMLAYYDDMQKRYRI
jgi:ATP-dependent 26S proteasome regulatory subunit